MDFYSPDGLPIDLFEFERLYADPAVWRVARSKVTDAADPTKSFDVSTVWLGLDYSFGNGPPVIFETMVFAEGESGERDSMRYSTRQQAKDGHVLMTVEVAAELTDPIVMDAE